MVNDKLNPKGIAIATAILTAIFYIICFILVFSFDNFAYRFFNLFFHGIDLIAIKSDPSITNGIIGFIASVIIAYVAGYIFGIIYNKFSR